MKKRVIKSILNFLILQLLKNNSLNGNQIAKEINKQYNVDISPTTIYTTLTRLKNDNLITQIPGKIYTLTQQGERMRVQMKKSYLCLQKNIEQQLKER